MRSCILISSGAASRAPSGGEVFCAEKDPGFFAALRMTTPVLFRRGQELSRQFSSQDCPRAGLASLSNSGLASTFQLRLGAR
jgi:hypothetical protein